MSRSGYADDFWDDQWAGIRWRGAVTSAIRGKRGQAFLRELLTALDAMPEKRLITGALATPEGEVCALGCVGRARGLDMSGIDIEEPEEVASAFGITHALTSEIEWYNDDGSVFGRSITPEERFARVRAWVASLIAEGGST